jgi:hypothetical protein
LTLDHIFPQKVGEKDDPENLVYACRICNSSKGKKDLMEWMNFRGEFLPLVIIRRYLKLAYNYCLENQLLENKLSELEDKGLPFKINFIPLDFPAPDKLVLNIK